MPRLDVQGKVLFRTFIEGKDHGLKGETNFLECKIKNFSIGLQACVEVFLRGLSFSRIMPSQNVSSLETICMLFPLNFFSKLPSGK